MAVTRGRIKAVSIAKRRGIATLERMFPGDTFSVCRERIRFDYYQGNLEVVYG